MFRNVKKCLKNHEKTAKIAGFMYAIKGKPVLLSLVILLHQSLLSSAFVYNVGSGGLVSELL